jgi:hypothetical protein
MTNPKTDDLLVAIDELNADMDDLPAPESGGVDLYNAWGDHEPEEHLIDPDSVDSDLSRAGEVALRSNMLADPT